MAERLVATQWHVNAADRTRNEADARAFSRHNDRRRNKRGLETPLVKRGACPAIIALVLVSGAIPGSGPAFAQDPQVWIDHNIATGQAAVLDHMNREAAKKAHRDAGLPPPDFKAAERRVRNSQAASSKAMSPAQRARNCAIVRDNFHRLDDRQMAIYRRSCG